MLSAELPSSSEEYVRRLCDAAFWEPYVRRALAASGCTEETRIWSGTAGTYPTFLTESDLVVKLFGELWSGPRSHAAELDAYRLLAGQDLPVPRLVASGRLFGDDRGWAWPYLVLTRTPGTSYGNASDAFTDTAEKMLADQLGGVVRRLHSVPIRPGQVLEPSGAAYAQLLERRMREAPDDYRRWGVLRPHLCDELSDWLPNAARLLDPSPRQVLLHGDLPGTMFWSKWSPAS